MDSEKKNFPLCHKIFEKNLDYHFEIFNNNRPRGRETFWYDTFCHFGRKAQMLWS